MAKGRRKKRKRRVSSDLKKQRRGIFYIITLIFGIIFSSSAIAIFNNSGRVAIWIYWAGGLALVVLFILIYLGWFTTAETIAFKKR